MKKISTTGILYVLQGLLIVLLITVAISCGKSGAKPATTTPPTIIAPGAYLIVNAANPNGCLATGAYDFNFDSTFLYNHGAACTAIPNETGTYSVTNGVLTVTVSGQTVPYLKGSIANVTNAGFDYTDAGSSTFPNGIGATVHFYSITLFTN